ncbi:MAG: hypothetical protein JW760_14545 [Spirochaetales bacterium]|nr:hypothetical protein [Spirochaetales bacterium]
MSVKQYLGTQPLNMITRYNSRVQVEKECVSFIGAPKKHPYDQTKLLLIVDAFTNDTLFYEFKLEDIMQVDEETGLATEEGESILMAKIWVRRGALALRYEPFEVDDPPKYLKDSELLHQTLSEMEQRP